MGGQLSPDLSDDLSVLKYLYRGRNSARRRDFSTRAAED